MIKKFFQDAISSPENHALSFAPGRIEFLGNHLDYNQGVVLGMAIDAGIFCLGVPQSDSSFSMTSEGLEDAIFKGHLENIQKQEDQFFWANYPLGVLKELQKRNLAPNNGFRLFFSSNLPTSVGLSSSAALELATALTLLKLANKKMSKEELVKLCRAAENNFVGMPCGILDQGTSVHGKKDHLVQIDCSSEVFHNIPLPKDTQIWIFDTGIKHDLVDSLYSTRHQECTEALEKIRETNSGIPSLASVDQELLNKVNLAQNLEKRALHVSQEQTRVQNFCRAIKTDSEARTLGKLLVESHVSSSEKFENSCPELGYLVNALIQNPSVFGSRLTGGGFGGAVMAWTDSHFTESHAEQIALKYRSEFESQAKWYSFKAADGARYLDFQDL